MIKANDWLLKEGHITEIKRGRRSAENIQRLLDAHKNGIKFSDWEPKETVSESTGETKITNTVKTAGGSQIDNFAEPFIRYPGDMNDYVVTDSKGNHKDYSLRTACICGYSLVGHLCNTPMVVGTHREGHVAVTITRKGA